MCDIEVSGSSRPGTGTIVTAIETTNKLRSEIGSTGGEQWAMLAGLVVGVFPSSQSPSTSRQLKTEKGRKRDCCRNIQSRDSSRTRA